jgi:predicted Zn-dependent protease
LSIEDFIDKQPSIPIIYDKILPDNEKEAIKMMSARIAKTPGNIVLGITNEGIWYNAPPRYIFGLGNGLISLKRFRSDSSNMNQVKSRFGKEVIKILSLVSGMGSCTNKKCILVYHWKVEDFDLNMGVCENCRDEFGNRLKYLLKTSDII